MSEDDVSAEAVDWVGANWDPDLTVGEWWTLLADAGYSHPTLSESAGGRGYSRSQNRALRQAMADAGTLGPPSGLGMMLAAPTIEAHGTVSYTHLTLPTIYPV